jgi:FKBP-type peptidyl-prolyl cis-trans isomerase
MFNKFELIGIAVSIMSMAFALYLINLETSTIAQVTGSSNAAQSALVVVGNEDDNQNALRDALLEGTTANGTVDKLIIDDVVIGTGDAVAVGDTVVVHYIGTLQNGQEFDNSNKRGEPFEFTLGAGKVITGWEEGIIGMQKGGKRILVVPAEKGYGKSGFGPIPGNTTLVFSIELLEIKK